MNIEDYFDFLAPDDIRIKGHRIGIESVLFEFLHRDRCPEEIQQIYPTLSLEEIYATVLYYLHDKPKVSKYVADWLEWSDEARQAASLNPSPGEVRLKRLLEEISAYPVEERTSARSKVRERERLNRSLMPAGANTH